MPPTATSTPANATDAVVGARGRVEPDGLDWQLDVLPFRVPPIVSTNGYNVLSACPGLLASTT